MYCKKIKTNAAGYHYINLDGKAQLVHRIIAEACVPKDHADMDVVHHWDEDKANNDPSNLDWMFRGDHSFLHSSIDTRSFNPEKMSREQQHRWLMKHCGDWD